MLGLLCGPVGAVLAFERQDEQDLQDDRHDQGCPGIGTSARATLSQPLRQRFVLRAVAEKDVVGEFRVAHGYVLSQDLQDLQDLFRPRQVKWVS